MKYPGNSKVVVVKRRSTERTGCAIVVCVCVRVLEGKRFEKMQMVVTKAFSRRVRWKIGSPPMCAGHVISLEVHPEFLVSTSPSAVPFPSFPHTAQKGHYFRQDTENRCTYKELSKPSV